MEKEINGAKYTLKKIKYLDMLGIDSENKVEMSKQTFLLGSNITEDQLKELDIAEAMELLKYINEFNGLDKIKDFQKPVKG